MPSIIQEFIHRLFNNKKQPSDTPIPEVEDPFPKEAEGYAAIISQYIPYFNRLSEQEKQRFIKRVYYFKFSKQFHFVGLEEKPEMSILISAAAIQLTFGLPKYKLSYFRDIYVVADAYTIPQYPELYIGDVSQKG